MIDTKEIRRLAQAVSEWSNCNQAWLDQSEDDPAAVVGHIDEDGITYPVATIDCDQYYAAHHSLPLAKFYAAANPAVVSELLDRLEAAESARRDDYQNWMTALDRNAELLAKLEAAEKERDWHAERCEDAMNECNALRAMLRAALDVLEDVKGNINPERGYADELEADVERVIAVIVIPGAKGE